MARTFQYFDDNWRSQVFTCPTCEWEGRIDEMSKDRATDLSEYSCPSCDNSLVIVGDPTIDQMQRAAQEGKLGAAGQTQLTTARALHERRSSSMRLPTSHQIDSVLALLPCLDAETQFFLESEDATPFYLPASPIVDELERRLYENGFVLRDFRWADWNEGREHGADHGWIASANLKTLCQLLTAHVRNDRFCSGALASACSNGVIQAILRRLAELRPSELGPIKPECREGGESFHFGGQSLDFDLLSFWQWSFSDVVSNTTRGVLAEYLVARALGVVGDHPREEWAPFDLEALDGTAVEVKSAAYIQSWHQKRFSQISFRVPKTHGWDKGTGQFSEAKRRQADVYVFALLAHKDQATLDPLNLSQWQFFVVPTHKLDERRRSQHSITLKSLKELSGESISFFALKQAVQEAGRLQKEKLAPKSGNE